jgi:cytochrome P450
MLNDPVIWGDPENFRPEVFMKQHNSYADELPSPSQIMFRFGARYEIESMRSSINLMAGRICPGMYLADRLGFHIVVTALYLYETVPLEGGERHHPDTVQYTGNTVR